MSACELTPLVSAWHDGEMASEETLAFEAHLAECKECQAEADALRGLSDMLASASPQEPDSQTMERLHSVADRFRERRVLLFSRRLTTAAAALLAICVGLTIVSASQKQAYAEVQVWETTAVTADANAISETHQFAQWVVSDLGMGEEQ